MTRFANTVCTAISGKTVILSALQPSTIEQMSHSDNFHYLFNHLITGVALTDTAFTIGLANDALCSMFSMSKADIVGKNLFSLFDGDEHTDLQSKIIRGGVSNFVIGLKGGVGNARSCMVSAGMLRTDSGALQVQFNFSHPGAHVYTHDVHKNMHQSLSRVFRTLAHDIKNPLNNIGLSVEQLISTISDEESEPLLKIISRNAGRINTILSALTASLKPPDLEQLPMDLNRFLRAFVEEVKAASRYPGVSISVLIPDSPMIVAADGSLLKDALELILNNCAEAQTATITIESFTTEFLNHVRITDDGCGINPADLQHVFQPYFSTKSTGGGMGLTTVMNILSAHDAVVDISPDPSGNGTVVVLSFKKPS